MKQRSQPARIGLGGQPISDHIAPQCQRQSRDQHHPQPDQPRHPIAFPGKTPLPRQPDHAPAHEIPRQHEKHHHRLMPQPRGQIKRLRQQSRRRHLRQIHQHERPQMPRHHRQCAQAAHQIQQFLTISLSVYINFGHFRISYKSGHTTSPSRYPIRQACRNSRNRR